MNNLSTRLGRLAATCVLMLATLSECHADVVRLYRENTIPDPAVVARVLARPMRARGVVLDTAPVPDGGEEAREAAGDAQPVAASASRARPVPHPAMRQATALALLIRFGNDSANLEPDAAAPLDAVAAGIRLAGFDHRIVIEGHANATGGATRNRALSQARAEAVRRYLMERGGVPGSLLLAKGYGADRPLAGHARQAPENRRVQFRAMS
jgi:outer membrane protein OmpA-like peptidoglycan-associated protein